MTDEDPTVAGPDEDLAPEPGPETAGESQEAGTAPVEETSRAAQPGAVSQGEPSVAPPPPPPPPPPPAGTVVPPVEVLPGPVSDSEKILVILGYIFGIVALVALFIEPYKHSPFVRLNAVQALGLWVIGLLWWIPLIGWLLGLLAFILAIIAIIKAFSGEYYRIPVIYDVLKGFIEQ